MGQLKKYENYLFMGARVKPLLLGEETDGNFSVFEITEVQGLEPPFHIHEKEDEIWRIVEGEATFLLENKVIEAGTGDTVFIHCGKAHAFKLKSKTMKAILSLTSTDLENIIREMAVPCQTADDLPNERPTEEQLDHLIALGKNYGLTIRAPEHTT